MSKRVSLLGMSLAAAMLLSFIESLVPPLFSFPGIKLGLANIAVIFSLYCFGIREACLISYTRVLLSALLFGNSISLIYSLAGATLSILTMALLKKTQKFTIHGVSIAGAVTHNTGQILAAIIIVGSNVVLTYLPVLLISGTITGALIGLTASIAIKKLYNKI